VRRRNVPDSSLHRGDEIGLRKGRSQAQRVTAVVSPMSLISVRGCLAAHWRRATRAESTKKYVGADREVP
jgi:hypothetical protein